MQVVLLGLISVVAALGWLVGYKRHGRSADKRFAKFRHDYFVGLNYLINEQPDKAVDVFIKMIEVDSDTVETHLALGHLFRRRGEVDRSIRIHQNLIARPQLERTQRMHALSELGLDYMSAGVLDRAERLFLELVEMTNEKTASLRSLLDIYQRQKDWEQAISVIQKLEMTTGQKMGTAIAQCHCELAECALSENDYEAAAKQIKKALNIDKNCVRASLIQGRVEQELEHYKAAIRCYQRVKNQDPDFISEIITPLSLCYEKIGDEEALIHYLKECLIEHPRISLVLALSEHLRKLQGNKVAIDFIAEQIRRYPSLRAVGRLIELYLHNSNGDARDKLSILQGLVEKLLAEKPIYRCNHCGFAGKILYWLCPGCKEWNTVRPIHGLEGD